MVWIGFLFANFGLPLSLLIHCSWAWRCHFANLKMDIQKTKLGTVLENSIGSQFGTLIRNLIRFIMWMIDSSVCKYLHTTLYITVFILSACLNSYASNFTDAFCLPIGQWGDVKNGNQPIPLSLSSFSPLCLWLLKQSIIVALAREE